MFQEANTRFSTLQHVLQTTTQVSTLQNMYQKAETSFKGLTREKKSL